MQEEIKVKLKLKPNELVIMSNLYLNTSFPHNFITLEDVSTLLKVSKATAMNIMRSLDKKGFVMKERGYITFYYPINDQTLRRGVLAKLGFFKE